MGQCCPGSNSGNDGKGKPDRIQSLDQDKGNSTTQSIGLSSSKKSDDDKKEHKRRHTSTKGMTRLTMKFPHIRYSFNECKKVFNSTCGDERKHITKTEVRPLLVQLGAESNQLTDDEIDRIVKTANLDGDNKINFKEFLIAAAVGCFLNESMDQEAQSEAFKKIRKGFLVAREAFDFIDEDGSGEVDYEELKKAFSAMKHDELIVERLKELDFNGDKSIEFPEFVWGITAWVGMDPDADDGLSIEDYEDKTTQANSGDVASPKHRLSIDGPDNPNTPDPNPTDDD